MVVNDVIVFAWSQDSRYGPLLQKSAQPPSAFSMSLDFLALNFNNSHANGHLRWAYLGKRYKLMPIKFSRGKRASPDIPMKGRRHGI